MRVGTSLISKKLIKNAPLFRYVFLENDQIKDVQLLQYPLALQKLGLFIMAVYTQVKQLKSAKPKPLVISVQNSHLKKTLVIAVTGA